MDITHIPPEMNDKLLKDLINEDDEGILEALMRLVLEHGMPYENLAGFMLDYTNLISRWSEWRNN